MRRSVHFVATLLAAAGLALIVLVSVSARTDAAGRYGGTLTVGLSIEPDALDPTVSRQFTAVIVYRTFCEKLYDLGAKAQIVPQLAAETPVISKDKLSYTIQLRKGIVFNDGTPFNADAVVTTLQRNMTHPESTRASDLESVGSVTASGPYTVVLHLTSPSAPLRDYLSTAATAIMSPSQLDKLGDDFATNPICVGPFMYDGRNAGESITVIKSPYYYDQKHVFLDKIVFKVASSPPAAAAALKAGDIQVLNEVSTTELEGLKQTSSLRIIERSTNGFVSIRINIGNKNGCCVDGHPPYANVGTPLASSAKLRKAFEEAIDRETMGRVLFGGRVQFGCKPISPASRWFDPSITCTPYDPADAKKLVAASGVTDPTVHLLTPTSNDNPLVAQFIQSQEKVVGINVVIETADNVAANARTSAGNFDAALGGWNGGRNDPDSNMYTFLTTSGSKNWGGYHNPRLDLILENGRKATTTTARTTLYRVAQQIILDDRPVIYLYHPIRYAAVNTGVTGVQLGPDLAPGVAFAQLK